VGLFGIEQRGVYRERLGGTWHLLPSSIPSHVASCYWRDGANCEGPFPECMIEGIKKVGRERT
jgi:hypothetical protein